jgi:hypothetical protein
MVVRTQENHLGLRGSVGLHIGALNVQQFFPRDMEMVELELDHLCIVCPLEPSFWNDLPEIHDQRLSCWLEAKRTSGKLAPQGAPVALIPSGKSSFRLQMIAKEEVDRALTSPVQAKVGSATAVILPAASGANTLLEQRRHDAGRKPERRKIAPRKLLNFGGDERSSVAASH